jgi:hypothetical protein
MASEPERLRDEPMDNNCAHASSRAGPKAAEKKIWFTPKVRVERLTQTKGIIPTKTDGLAPGDAFS